MKKVKLTEATGSLAEYTKGLGRHPLVVTANGKPVAALVPIEDTDLESLSLGTNPEFLDLIETSRRRAREEGTLSSEEVRRQLKIKPLPTGKKVNRGKRKKAVGKRRATDASA